MFKPTDAQRTAITNRGGALLVAAAAGSGKTRVLTERLVSYINDTEQPRSIEDFLVITYTRAAASELRSRIGDELASLSAAAPNSKRLRRETALVQRAEIGTIHSFCSKTLREHSHLVGLTPDFAIADEERAIALRRLALERTLEKAYESAEPGFLALADSVGAGKDDKRLSELLLTLHDRLQSHARPEDWCNEQLTALAQHPEDAGKSPWSFEILEEARQEAAYRLGQLEDALALMSECLPIQAAYFASFSDSCDSLRAFIAASARGWEAARNALPIAYPRLKPLRNCPDAELAEELKNRRAACKKATERLERELSRSEAQLSEEMRKTAPAMAALLKLALEFDACYSAEKRRRGLVDYPDLEHMTARLLTDREGKPTETALNISRRYAEVMVDEYQDVSRVQELIIRAVSGGGQRLFMVGDVKQSIYRFRLADPGIFIEKYLSYKDAADAKPGEPRRVFLRESFRSRPEVVDAVNAVFSSIMSERLGELRYDENARLAAAFPYEGSVPPPELTLVTLPDTGDDEQRPDKTAIEARYVAAKIRELVDSGLRISDSAGARPLAYGDIAILLRSANLTGGVYRRELTLAGVPVEAGGGVGFFEAPETSVLLSLLAVIDNPRQDVPLIAVLRSELFGFTPDELGAVRAAEKNGDFWLALCTRAEEDEKCRAFLDTLSSLRDYARDAELGALLVRIYESLDIAALCRALPDGTRRRANLDMLRELAREFEASGWRGLHRFMLWLDSQKQRGRERSAPQDAAGGVRIMSIHSSKGLEFPVVFLCDTNRQFNMQDTRQSVLVHPELGLGPKLTDTQRGVEYPTTARRALARRIERETLSEELRLLYVAMTRAKERLFITCAAKDPDALIAKLEPIAQSPVHPQELLVMRCPAQWLIAAALADGQEHIVIDIAEAEDAEPPALELPEREIKADASDAECYERLISALGWRYPHEAAQSLPSKITATELKGLIEPDAEAQPLLPRRERAFRAPVLEPEAAGADALRRGTATHQALRYIDFAAASAVGGVEAEIKRLAVCGKLSESEAAITDVRGIERLIGSELGRRILAAREIMRELPFTLLCASELIYPDVPGEELLLQGVVDLCLREEDGLVVIDYKTDRVTGDELRTRARRYAPQLRTYTHAMHRLTGLPIKAAALYFLRTGEVYWMDADTAL